MYLLASPTVLIFSAASSGISTPNSSSKAITSSTMSRLSGPRSSMKLASGGTLSSSTPRCSTTIFLTRSAVSLMCCPLEMGGGFGNRPNERRARWQVPRKIRATPCRWCKRSAILLHDARGRSRKTHRLTRRCAEIVWGSIFMKFHLILSATAALCVMAGGSVAVAKGESSGQKQQQRGEAQIPHCTHKLGTVAIVEADNQWWRELNLGSPEAVIKVFVQESGCFTIVNRGRAMQSRSMERVLADNGELQAGSNLGKGQVKAADYFLQPDIVTSNNHSGGGGLGAVAGGLLGH